MKLTIIHGDTLKIMPTLESESIIYAKKRLNWNLGLGIDYEG